MKKILACWGKLTHHSVLQQTKLKKMKTNSNTIINTTDKHKLTCVLYITHNTTSFQAPSQGK